MSDHHFDRCVSLLSMVTVSSVASFLVYGAFNDSILTKH